MSRLTKTSLIFLASAILVHPLFYLCLYVQYIEQSGWGGLIYIAIYIYWIVPFSLFLIIVSLIISFVASKKQPIVFIWLLPESIVVSISLSCLLIITGKDILRCIFGSAFDGAQIYILFFIPIWSLIFTIRWFIHIVKPLQNKMFLLSNIMLRFSIIPNTIHRLFKRLFILGFVLFTLAMLSHSFKAIALPQFFLLHVIVPISWSLPLLAIGIEIVYVIKTRKLFQDAHI
ncbi:MAG: hypothetical protein COA79_21885 [Planctomycetota bacterium]|nr:MAG: hypothetical protein COA79_21885 [Planctomycetota bacterium]